MQVFSLVNYSQRGATLLKQKHTKSSTVENDTEVTTVEFTEVNFSYQFIISCLYRPIVFEKYLLLLYQFIIRFVFILYNYQTLSASVLHSLVYYFQFILDYIDETPNLTEDVEYNEKKKDQLIHSLRPSLFNVDLFEVLNRILHEPVVHSSSSHLSDHDKEIVALSKIAKQIVTVVFLSYIIV